MIKRKLNINTLKFNLSHSDYILGCFGKLKMLLLALFGLYASVYLTEYQTRRSTTFALLSYCFVVLYDSCSRECIFKLSWTSRDGEF